MTENYSLVCFPYLVSFELCEAPHLFVMCVLVVDVVHDEEGEESVLDLLFEVLCQACAVAFHHGFVVLVLVEGKSGKKIKK